MKNIRLEWFNNEESPKIIKCPTISLLKDKEDIVCYLLSLNLYPKFQPKLTHYSYILENNQTGYLIICGNNHETIGHMKFKFIKGE
ncbi:hypothetical protein [Spiroplasma ixodetis]|uniref:hypothetical protein n=1 Tax=Spiroplasma ixodetis TaxID=2141 RepID=UPI002575ABAD|nr:hypothetical protein [Spiroplasma ixodetis]WJG70883.1 hypothetical protein SIXOD_v1c21680 [Spiroplasma ixodetis Y32]